jgi:hypothetical protein
MVAIPRPRLLLPIAQQHAIDRSLDTLRHKPVECYFEDQRPRSSRTLAHHEALLDAKRTREKPLLNAVLAFEHDLLTLGALLAYTARTAHQIPPDPDGLDAKVAFTGETHPVAGGRDHSPTAAGLAAEGA